MKRADSFVSIAAEFDAVDEALLREFTSSFELQLVAKHLDFRCPLV